MTVVVTGAAGFVGSHLVAELLAQGERVVAVDRRAGCPDGAEQVVIDLLAPDARAELVAVLREADAVFHLAGRPGVRGDGPGLARARWRDNVLAGSLVLAATPRAVPLVVASSSSVYGGALHGGRLVASAEHDAPRPRGDYARTKLELERRCAARAVRGGLVAVARPFTVAGEGQRPDMAIARWLAAARAGRPLRVLGAPERTRDVTDVRDVVRGLVALARLGRCTTVNLGTGVGTTLADIAAAVAAATGADSRLVVEPARREEPPATLADTRRCRALLGFRPRADIVALVARQAEAGSPVRETELVAA